ncbi:DNA-binding protein [Gordonia sp. HNM0687]|uniref:DNA-binding protein n=1 Tax=Gordonia mangrovi TaxID=2665643 RepID=A0A6L7GNZ2_9ACTN|nr:DNA-binding protein [Gordonia mangrovi]MXP20268.1 DNA-binding protein [Gordonia mangrovi]UVF79126.1 DNA-binding protein [Gordonia mangrovi]
MSTADDDLDHLLRDRFDLDRETLVAALRTLPAQRPGAARLTEGEARLLDAAGFTENPDDYAQIAADVTAHMARLYSTALSASEVAKGLQVSDSRVRQRRLAHTLWAIHDGRSWVFPVLQFEHIEPDKLKHVRGLDQVLPQLLSRGLHPTAVAGFLESPQPQLLIGGQPRSVRQWLLHGESVQAVLELLEIADWTAS